VPEFRHLTAPLACLFLSGCAPDSGVPDMMDDYVGQVANALDLSPELSEVGPVSQIPRRRERVLDMPDLDMGMLDFLSLYGCQLQFVVGERNSIMGRVMQPLNRLRYETRFIHAAQECIPETDREGVKEDLDEAIKSKMETLPIAVWNATWGVEEIERLFTLSQGLYPGSADDEPVAELANDARKLNRTVAGLLHGGTEEPLDYVGDVHQRWQAEHRAGQLLNSARLLTTRLNDATALLVRRIENDPLCPEAPEEPPAALREAYGKGYVDSVESYLDNVEKARDDLIEPLDTLAAQQAEIMPAAFHDWYRQYLDTTSTDSLWGQLDQAREAHDQRWQQLLSQCGIAPDNLQSFSGSSPAALTAIPGTLSALTFGGNPQDFFHRGGAG